MSGIIEDVSNLRWWFSVVIVGFVLNFVAQFVWEKIIPKYSEKRKKRSLEDKVRFEKRVDLLYLLKSSGAKACEVCGTSQVWVRSHGLLRGYDLLIAEPVELAYTTILMLFSGIVFIFSVFFMILLFLISKIYNEIVGYNYWDTALIGIIYNVYNDKAVYIFEVVNAFLFSLALLFLSYFLANELRKNARLVHAARRRVKERHESNYGEQIQDNPDSP